jgi:hypothetical protein
MHTHTHTQTHTLSVLDTFRHRTKKNSSSKKKTVITYHKSPFLSLPHCGSAPVPQKKAFNKLKNTKKIRSTPAAQKRNSTRHFKRHLIQIYMARASKYDTPPCKALTWALLTSDMGTAYF